MSYTDPGAASEIGLSESTYRLLSQGTNVELLIDPDVCWQLVFGIFASLAEFERDPISERTSRDIPISFYGSRVWEMV